MLKHTILSVLLVVVLFLVTGCATTGDPTKGGIFWSQEKADQRRMALENDLGRAQAEGYRLSSETAALEYKGKKLQQQLAHQKQQIAVMDTEARKLQQQLQSKKKLSSAKRRQKEQAEQQLAEIKREIETLKTSKYKDIETRKKRIKALNEEIEALSQAIANL